MAYRCIHCFNQVFSYLQVSYFLHVCRAPELNLVLQLFIILLQVTELLLEL